MPLAMTINIHLETGDSVTVEANDFPEHSFCNLVIREPDTYGDLTIFFPRRSLAKVQAIARLIREAMEPNPAPTKPDADVSYFAGGHTITEEQAAKLVDQMEGKTTAADLIQRHPTSRLLDEMSEEEAAFERGIVNR